ncbi:MAG: CehA/McbA family metallohydrolase [Caldilineaceae bacterium]|nr:CehA/McbA family metallohydrolase [Caldilineaceae bacterium]
MNQTELAGRFFEYFGNIHMHTTHSDGFGSFDDLVDGAVRGGLDFVFVTDHNVLVREEEEGYRQGVLTLVGQEVHDTEQELSGNHLLCLGVETDVSDQAKDQQRLIDAVNEQNALAFLAHPIEEKTDLFPKYFPWRNWEVTGYHGVELWNYLSGFRSFTTGYLRTVLVAFFPKYFTVGPLPAMLEKWDELTQSGKVVALGGTDVHSVKYSLGPITRRFLTYEECAKALNTHILTESPLLGQPESDSCDYRNANTVHDRGLVLEALRRGHCWLGYDLAGPTAGFRFWADGAAAISGRGSGAQASQQVEDDAQFAVMGDKVRLAAGQAMTLNVQTPEAAEIRLLRNGRLVTQGRADTLSYRVHDPGVYRVEVWKHRWGKLRGWIFSNPIYVEAAEGTTQ